MKKISLALLAIGFFSATSHAKKDIQTVDHVDAAKFVGTWYRIAANKIVFETACACARQVLTPQADGSLAVYNSCNKKTVDGKLTEIRGTAVSENAGNSKFSVDFGLPWKGQYWIIAVDSEYRYAVVTDNFGYSLYVMSKTPQLEMALYNQAVEQAQKQVNTSHLVGQVQKGCTYPPAN